MYACTNVFMCMSRWGESGPQFKSGKFSKTESEAIIKRVHDYASANGIPVEVSNDDRVV